MPPQPPYVYVWTEDGRPTAMFEVFDGVRLKAKQLGAEGPPDWDYRAMAWHWKALPFIRVYGVPRIVAAFVAKQLD